MGLRSRVLFAPQCLPLLLDPIEKHDGNTEKLGSVLDTRQRTTHSSDTGNNIGYKAVHTKCPHLSWMRTNIFQPGQVKEKASRIQRGREGVTGNPAQGDQAGCTHSSATCSGCQWPLLSPFLPSAGLVGRGGHWGRLRAAAKIKRKMLYCKGGLRLNVRSWAPSTVSWVSEFGVNFLNSVSTFPSSLRLCRNPPHDPREISWFAQGHADLTFIQRRKG